MPIYEYWCEDHGVFTEMRPMAASATACACPQCGRAAPRVMVTPPRLGGMPDSRRRAHETNERAADSPKRLSSHGPSCLCCKGGLPTRKTLKTADGAKSFPTARPWMISH